MIYLLALLGAPPLYHLYLFFPVCSIILACIVLAVLTWKKQYIAIVLVVLGVSYAHVRNMEATIPPGLQGEYPVSGYFTKPAREIEGGYVQEFYSKNGQYTGIIDVLTGEKFEVGGQYSIVIKLYGPGGKVNPGAWHSEPFAVLVDMEGPEGVEHSPMVSINRARDRLNSAIFSALPLEEAALVAAVTTGDRNGLTHELREAFRASGLAHLLSISGTHFGLIGVLLFALFRALLLRLPVRMLERLTQYVTPTEVAAILTFPFMVYYLLISGARIPSVRSFFMMSLFLMGLLIGRKGSWLNFLTAAAVVLVYWDPEVMFSLSFQLSFVAVLFIGAAVRGGRYRGMEVPDIQDDEVEDENGPPSIWRRFLMAPRLRRYVVTSLVISLAASAGVGPLVAYHFHYGSFMSPLANLLVTPLVCMVLVPLSLVSSLFFMLFGTFPMGSLIHPVAAVSIGLVKWFGGLPVSSVSFGPMPPAVPLLFYLGCLVWFVYRKRSLLVLPVIPLIAWMVLSPLSGADLRVTFLDTGRSDGIVIELPDSSVLVLDTGWRGTQVDNYLRYRGIKEIDALILSSGKKEHAGGVQRLYDRYTVGELWDPGHVRYDDPLLEELTRRRLVRGTSAGGGGWDLTALHPYEGYSPDGEGRKKAVNNASLVLRLESGNTSILFTGDVEYEAIRNILTLGPLLQSQVLKVPHHAMEREGIEKLLPAVRPEMVIITNENIPRYTAGSFRGYEVLVTGIEGAVKVEERNGERTYSTFADFQLQEAIYRGREWKNLRRLFQVW